MNTLIVACFVLALLVLGISLLLHRHRVRFQNAQVSERTLAGCAALLQMISGMQQHRGISSAWLAGDASFKPRLDAKAAEIEKLFPLLREVARCETAMAHPCLTLNDFSLFHFNWQSLREKLGGLSVEQSIAQHSFFVDQLLQWLSALGEARLEGSFTDPAYRGLVRNYVGRLPALTECLGQARALGMSVAARRGCSAVSRVRLMFLVARAESLLRQAGEVAGQGREGMEAASAVQQLARLIRTQMLQSSGITLDAQDYFSVATAAIDLVFAWITASGKQLIIKKEKVISDGRSTGIQRA